MPNYINDGTHNVPENTIAIMGYQSDKTYDVIRDMRGNKYRDGFPKTASACLPMSIANQTGFAIVSLSDFTMRWNGGHEPSSVSITCEDAVPEGFYGHGEDHVYGNPKQMIAPFYSGMISIKHDFFIRTPLGVNMFVTQVPNNFIPATVPVSAMIETDNAVRDWVFNLKITVPNIDIHIKKGDPLIGLIPVPRFFADSFTLKSAYDIFETETLRTTFNEALMSSAEIKNLIDEVGDPLSKDINGGMNGLYALGKTVGGFEFYNHQKTIGKSNV
jgi:hypothetical protein